MFRSGPPVERNFFVVTFNVSLHSHDRELMSGMGQGPAHRLA